jgi:hypothetical protein
VWGRDDDTWPTVLGRRLEARGWTVALVEAGTGGATARLLGEAAWLRSTRTIPTGDASAPDELTAIAATASKDAGAAIGLAVRAVESGGDTRVEVAAVGPWGIEQSSSTAFLGGSEGRRRAGIAAASFLDAVLRKDVTG